MDKLTLEHLAPYLPYGLKCHNMGNIDDDGNAFISDIVGLDQDSVWVSHEHEDGDYDYRDTFPILRPLSDLTKEIEHKGERFVPIVELFKLRTQSTGDKIFDYYIENDTAILRLEGQHLDNLTFKCFFEVDLEPGQIMFSIASETWDDFGDGKLIDERIDMCGNEMTMFQKLYEWHFDVFGLIGQNLAIGKDELYG